MAKRKENSVLPSIFLRFSGDKVSAFLNELNIHVSN